LTQALGHQDSLTGDPLEKSVEGLDGLGLVGVVENGVVDLLVDLDDVVAFVELSGLLFGSQLGLTLLGLRLTGGLEGSLDGLLDDRGGVKGLGGRLLDLLPLLLDRGLLGLVLLDLLTILLTCLGLGLLVLSSLRCIRSRRRGALICSDDGVALVGVVGAPCPTEGAVCVGSIR